MSKTEIFAEILECVANETELSKDLILSCDRKADVVDARYMIVYILLAKGFRRAKIADMLNISHRAVSQIATNFSLRQQQCGPLFRITLERIKKELDISSEKQSNL